MSGAVRRIFLEPGDFRFGASPLQFATLLGSCVTVTLWHPQRRIGGMCHYMLAERAHGRHRSLDGRFGNEAFRLFDAAIAKADSLPTQYQAKIFGGGDMFPGADFRLNVGAKNILMAHEQLRQRGIRLLAEHTGGAGHRKLVFDLSNGEVRLLFADLNKVEVDVQD